MTSFEELSRQVAEEAREEGAGALEELRMADAELAGSLSHRISTPRASKRGQLLSGTVRGEQQMAPEIAPPYPPSANELCSRPDRGPARLW